MSLSDGKDIKRACRGLKRGSSDRFLEISYNLLWVANTAKYDQHPRLRDELMATDGKRLVEVHTGKSIWGCGLTEDEATASALVNEMSWPQGCRNLFGDLLTLLRGHLLQCAGAQSHVSRVSEHLTQRSRSSSRKRPNSQTPSGKKSKTDHSPSSGL